MLTKEERIKNIKDLEYNHLLNKQNIFLGLIGASILSVILTSELPNNVNKTDVLILLILIGILVYIYFDNKLNKIIDYIKRINVK